MADGGSSNPQRQYHTGAPDKYSYSPYVNTGSYQTSYTHANEPVFQTGYTRPTEPPSYISYVPEPVSQTGYIPEPASQTGFTRPTEHPSQMNPFNPSHSDQQFSNRSVHTAPIYPLYRPNPLQTPHTGMPHPNPLSRTEFSGEGPNYHSTSSPSLTIHPNNYEGSSYNDHGRLTSQVSVPVTRSPHTGRRQEILSRPYSDSSDNETNRPHPSPANQPIEFSVNYPGVATPQNTAPVKSNSNPSELSRFGDIGNIPRSDQYHYQKPAVSPQKADLQQPMLTIRPYAGPADHPFENTRAYPNPQPRSDQNIPYRPTLSVPRQAWANENFSNPGSIPYQASETSQHPDSRHFRPIPDQYQYQTPTTPVSNPQNDPHFDHRNSKDSTSSNQSPSSSIKFSVSLATPPGGHKEKQDDTQNHQEMESKSRLIQEIAHLSGQKVILQEEIKVLREEKVALQQEQEELTSNMEKLKLEESRFKTRLAQAQQNLDLMKQIQQKEEQKRRQNGDKAPGNDTTVQEQQSRIEELEMTLRDREAEIKKKEIQLQTEADMLHQRAKELKLKEYDMMNFSGGKPAQSPAAFEHDAHQRQMDLDIKEQDLNSREQTLFLRENELQKWHKELVAKNNSLEQWQLNLQEEDNRVQENQKTASQMLAEVKKLEAQVLGAAAAADIEEQERRSSIGSKPRGAERADGIEKINITEPSVGFEIPPGDIGAEEIDKDEAFARALQMEINQQIFKESEEMVKRMAMESSPAPPSQEDEAFLWRAQLEAVGLIPGNDSVEEMKKRYEDFQRQRST